jgi:hypothetical protein
MLLLGDEAGSLAIKKAARDREFTPLHYWHPEDNENMSAVHGGRIRTTTCWRQRALKGSLVPLMTAARPLPGGTTL